MAQQEKFPVRTPANEGTIGQVQEFEGDRPPINPNMEKNWTLLSGLRFVKRFVEDPKRDAAVASEGKVMFARQARILQQQWFCHDTGETEWRDVPEVEE